MKIGLCLGGGGSRGYAHIGVIQALTEAGIKIDAVNGTSIGAVIGGMYALYRDVDKMNELVRQVVESINVNHFNLFRHSLPHTSFLHNWLNEAVCDIASMRRSLQSHKNNLKAFRIIFGERMFVDTVIPFSVITTDIIAGKTVVIKEGKIIDAVVASVSLPGIFPPVVRGKKLLVDGTVLSNIPVPELRREGADFIISIELKAEIGGEPQTGMDVLNFIESMKQKQLQNWALAESDFKINIDMSKYDGSRFEDYSAAIERGYQVAKKVMPRLKKKLEKASA